MGRHRLPHHGIAFGGIDANENGFGVRDGLLFVISIAVVAPHGPAVHQNIAGCVPMNRDFVVGSGGESQIVGNDQPCGDELQRLFTAQCQIASGIQREGIQLADGQVGDGNGVSLKSFLAGFLIFRGIAESRLLVYG